MPQFIKLSQPEKNELIIRASSKLHISPVLVEKDFWVSWLLNKIFQHEISKDIIFKGGTSLSKCYGIISRFSEDIDLTIDRKIFNNPENEESLSNKGLQRLIESNDKHASDFVNQTFKPILESIFTLELGEVGWKITPDEDEPKNLRFHYPSGIRTTDDPYVKQSVLIELGVRGEINPHEIKAVISYMEKAFADLLDPETSDIRTLSPLRTFWEKVTLLHAENHRPIEKSFGDRLSRHYYDLYQMIKDGVADRAISNLSLLYDVIDHKKKYFRAGWAQYETAVPGTLSITPNSYLQGILEKDYAQMQHMLFDEIPEFHVIIESLQRFEDRINDVNA
jgi:hypothetical protein